MSNERTPISAIIDSIAREGSRLASPVPVDGMPPMTFACSLSAHGASEAEIAALPSECPADLVEFWTIARGAKLFEDQQYGQWGLEILEPAQASAMTSLCSTKRARDFIKGDLVVGRFLGDSDLLVVRCEPGAADFGTVLVAPPIDPRRDWYSVASSLALFLENYVKAGGDKYWTT